MRPNGYQNVTVKMTVLFSNNAVANITVDDENQSATANCQGQTFGNFNQSNCQIKSNNVQNVASTQLCGFTIKLGDSAQTVQTACGKPVMMQSVQMDNQNDNSTQAVAELIYAGPPKVMLSFENGHLKDRTFL